MHFAGSRFAGKLVRILLVVVLVSLGTFLLLELIPGSAADSLVPAGATEAQRAQIVAAYGLDKPLAERYLSWAGGALSGDLGESIVSRRPVVGLLAQRLPISLEIAGLAIVLALVVALPVGVYSAYRPGGALDRFSTLAVSATLSVPSFLLGVLLLYVVSVRMGLLPVNGWVPFSVSAARHVRHLVLPVLTLAAAEAVLFIRVLRNDMIAVLQEDFVLSARTRGLSTPRILFGHALRPASFSLVTVLGVAIARLIGGTVIIEVVFGIPGVGQFVLTAISNRDVAVVQGTVLVIAVGYVLLNSLVDLSYPLLDPRVRSRTA